MPSPPQCFGMQTDLSSLGDCFCLQVFLPPLQLSFAAADTLLRRTNPRLPDHPIVLVSVGFEAVTGYSARAITGRNCRFLVIHPFSQRPEYILTSFYPFSKVQLQHRCALTYSLRGPF